MNLCVKDGWHWFLWVYPGSLLVFGAWYLGRPFAQAAIEPRTDRPPRVELPAELHDVGRVREGVIVHHHFVVRNTGDRELVLRRRFQKNEKPIRIAPGEAEALKVTLRTKGWSGRIRKMIRYTTNSPDRREIRLTMTALVVE